MFKRFMFKGQELEQGDIVTVRAGSFPLEFQAAVVDYDEQTSTLEVISTQLVLTRHPGTFSTDDIEQIMVIHKYDEGLQMEARAPLSRGQHCVVTVRGANHKARVVAAFDGVVTGLVYDTPGVDDDTWVTGGSFFWQPQAA